MRILWISPWMRPLARIHAEILRKAGHEVVLVTDEQHPEVTDTVAGEQLIVMGVKNPRSWRSQWRLRQVIRRFAPDVVVEELVRDPRVALACGRRPLVHVCHDDRPHDAGEIDHNPAARILARWRQRAAVTLVFSHYVAESVRATAPGVIHVVPLTSDVADAQLAHWAPAVPVPAPKRRNFVMLGRINAYKNVEVVLAAYAAHRQSAAFRGDELVIIGDGSAPIPAQPGVRWRRGAYTYATVLAEIAAAKASIAHYRVATQSGVQVLASQLAVASVVSTAGGLEEFLPAPETGVGIDDVPALTQRFNELADPDTAVARGLAAQAKYTSTHSAAAIAAALDSAVRAAVAR